jgi:hypothetical protein
MKAEIRILADVSSTGVAYLFKMKAERRQAAILGLHLSPFTCLLSLHQKNNRHSTFIELFLPSTT